jgi:hypothetical protein
MALPIVALLDPLRPWCEQSYIYEMSESFHANISYSGLGVVEKGFK